MKPELVCEERLEKLAAEAYAKHRDDPFSRKSCEIIAVDCARAALEELEIVCVLEREIDLHHWNERVFIPLTALAHGTVLVKVKDRVT